MQPKIFVRFPLVIDLRSLTSKLGGHRSFAFVHTVHVALCPLFQQHLHSPSQAYSTLSASYPSTPYMRTPGDESPPMHNSRLHRARASVGPISAFLSRLTPSAIVSSLTSCQLRVTTKLEFNERGRIVSRTLSFVRIPFKRVLILAGWVAQMKTFGD